MTIQMECGGREKKKTFYIGTETNHDKIGEIFVRKQKCSTVKHV